MTCHAERLESRIKRTKKVARLNSPTEVQIVQKTGRLEVCAKNREREFNQSETREERS